MLKTPVGLAAPLTIETFSSEILTELAPDTTFTDKLTVSINAPDTISKSNKLPPGAFQT